MDIKKIYEYLKQLRFLTFSTIDKGYVHSRIASIFAGDEDGFYFRTMFIKPFYRQLINTKNVTVCGMTPIEIKGYDENGVPSYPPGFTLRIIGDVRELSEKETRAKAMNNPDFKIAIFDMKKYPAMRNLCLYKGKGEIYDFDFEMTNRENKLYRERFSFGGADFNHSGSIITEKCTECGECYEACTFKAIKPGSPYQVMGERCDECGSCMLVCPADAIIQPLTF
ncbi:4Fe-4S binding protein [Thermodesulfobacteriota bacterium]